MQIRFRQGNLNDLDNIELLVRDAIIQMKHQGIEQWDERYPGRRDFEQDIMNNQLSVGMLGEDLAVVYTLSNESDEAYKNGQWKEPDRPYFVIHRLCVDPKIQNRGIAQQAMKQIEHIAYENGIQAIRLDVYSKNPFALSLYQNSGFEKVGSAQWRKGKFYLMEKYINCTLA